MKSKKRKSVSKHISLFSEDDLYLFNEGSHFRLYEKLGAHLIKRDNKKGTYFSVWAPDAEKIFVMGDFNEWDKTSNPLQPKESSGIWEGFVPGVGKGDHYKFHIISRYNNYRVDKADPFAFFCETPPKTGSIVWDLDACGGDWNLRSDSCRYTDYG